MRRRLRQLLIADVVVNRRLLLPGPLLLLFKRLKRLSSCVRNRDQMERVPLLLLRHLEVAALDGQLSAAYVQDPAQLILALFLFE